MNENCERGYFQSKILITIVVASFFFGNTTASVIERYDKNNINRSEQVRLQKVKGQVVTADGEPVIGASILEKGTSNGVITDLGGNFVLNVNKNAVLVISYIGYKTQEIKASLDMKIVMLEDNEMLDEVVVVGYGVQKKKLVTGATIQVKGESIAKLNTVNPLEALQSQAPGVNLIQNSGFLNAGYKMTIRGLGTNGNSSPLFVIDGVANASLDGLNPNDIESIDILKDAASASIYGARSANGVVLITTKKGKAGISEITYDGYVGWQNLYKIPTVLNAKEYMAIQDEGRIMDGLSPWDWKTYIPETYLKAIEEGSWQGTNWLKEILNKNAVVQNHSINITGGTDRSRYSIGASYTFQEATMGVPNDAPNTKRYNARVNSEHVVIRKNNLDFLKVGETINYKYQQTDGSFGTGGIYWNGVHNMLIMSPLMPSYNSDGDYYLYADQVKDGYKWDVSNGANKNPIAYLDYMMNQNMSTGHYMQSSFYAELQPIKQLRIKSQFGYIMSSSSYRSYIPRFEKLTENLQQEKDKVSQSMSQTHRWSWENTVNYLFDFKEHHFDFLLGQSLEKWGFGDSMNASAYNSSFYDFDHAYLSNVPFVPANIESLGGSPSTEGAIASFFGRVNYNFKEKYMASAVIRADGSSNFARGHRWGYFPSLSAGWVISNENFMQSALKWLDFLKLRASWGQNGNCSISPFQYLSKVTSNTNWGGYTFGDLMDTVHTGSYAYQLINEDLTWETQETIDIGVDARFFNHRFAVELDWYKKTTRDWLVTAPVQMNFGANACSINGGAIENTGFEAAFHWNDKINKDFNYGVNLNLAYNKNKVTKIENAEGILHGNGSILWEGADECFRAEVGKPIGFFYGYKSNGIFQNQEQIDNYKGAKINGDATQPGDVIWCDINNDNKIDENDRTEIGNPHPDFTMGFSMNASWKAFDIALTTYGAFGQQILKCYRDFVSSPLNNYTTDIFERWHGEGTSNKFPRISSASNTNWNKISDIYIENGDYLKIKNLTIGVDFKKLFKQLPMQQLRLYFTAQNLFTITGYSGMDPEIGYSGDSYSWSSGIDLGFYPSARTYMVGLNVKF